MPDRMLSPLISAATNPAVMTFPVILHENGNSRLNVHILSIIYFRTASVVRPGSPNLFIDFPH